MQPNEKFAFFGTPYVARDTLKVLVEHGFVPEVVVTNPDAPKGRGYELTPCETKEWAVANNLPVYTPEKLSADALAAVRTYGCEYAVVVAYGKIFPESFIALFPKGVLNVHYSLLPKYRGAAPVEAALLNGDTVTGVTVQKMVRELDAGDIIAQRELTILPQETTATLRPRLITLGAELLVETLPAFLRGNIHPIRQDVTAMSHYGKIDKTEAELDLSAPAEENWRKYRAYAEWPGTYFFTEKNGKRLRVKITSARMTESGIFEILRVIPEGKKEMDYTAFIQ